LTALRFELTSWAMKRLAILALVGMLAACGVQSDPNGQVQPAPFHALHSVYFKVVDHGSTYMQQLYDQVSVDRPGGITADRERWETPDGRALTDFYLAADSLTSLDAYLASHPALAVPNDRELAFERLESGGWRTYLVVPTAELDASSVSRAEATSDANTGRPAVMVDFTPPAALRFAQLTTRIVGHKLAVIADGTVLSAPVIMSPLYGGRAEVTVSSDAEARTLAAAFAR
jgi:preprotein translocase subunit SecD